MVQGDGVHDLCIDGSCTEVTVMLTTIDISADEAIVSLHCRQSSRSTRQRCRDHYTGDLCAHKVMIASTTGESFTNAAVLVYTYTNGSCSNATEVRTIS
jgi:hypothetical protein